jgi:endonuclease YncB( thermonuclease family)
LPPSRCRGLHGKTCFIDAPELGQTFGKRSRQSLAGICAAKMASVEWFGKDRYGRTLAA